MQQSPYRKLAKKLNMNMMGVPKRDGDFSPAFLEYLELLFLPEEAEIASYVAVDPERSTAQDVADAAGCPVVEVENILDRMAEKRVIFGISGLYVLPVLPVLVNIHQFVDGVDDETRRAAELYQDFFIKDEFYRFYQSSAKGTLRRRTVPIGQSISAEQQILPHEQIDAYLDRANMEAIALVPCPCRNRTEKMGTRECKDKYPVASCLVLGLPGMLFVARGEGVQVSREEAQRYVEEMRELGLVILTNNAAEMENGVVCFCCGCCCSVTRGLTRWNNPKAFARSSFVARVNEDCEACGACGERCFFSAISLPDDADMAQIDEDRCMGCGVCTGACPTEALRLERLEREPIFSTTAELQTLISSENEEAGQKSRAE